MLLPVFAAILVIAGFGLPMVQSWSRHMFLAGGLLGLPWLPQLAMRYTMNNTIFEYHVLFQYMPRTVMLTMLVVDMLVYAVLVWYLGVASAFGGTSADPYYSGGCGEL